MKISVCVDALYPKMDCANAIRRAAKAGSKFVETWSWWDKDLQSVEEALDETKCTMAALCTKFISLVDASCLAPYLSALEETISVCQKIGCNRIISQVGNELQDISRKEQHQQLVKGLKEAANLLTGTGIKLVFEPLNTRVDHQGYYLWSSDEGFEIANDVGSPNIAMLFDIYHQQIMEGDILKRLEKFLPTIAHIHMAAVPGRGCLSNGELSYENILKFLEQKGYEDCAALELFCNNPDEEIKQWTSFPVK